MLIPEIASMTEESQHISDLQSISPIVNDFIINEKYIHSDVEEGEINVNHIISQCYSLLISELRELGIVFSCDADEIIGDWHTARVVKYLRKHFDASTIFNFLVGLTEQQYDEFKSILDIVETEPLGNEILLANITNYMRDVYPHSEDWNVIRSNLDRIHSTHMLYEHLDAIIEDIEIRGIRSNIPEVDFDLLVKYTNKLAKHCENVEKAIITIMKWDKSLNRTELFDRIEKHDKDLTYIDSMYVLAKISIEPKELPKEMIKKAKDIVTTHKRTNRHHPESFINNNFIDITREDLVEMVADMYDPTSSKEVIMNKLEKKYGKRKTLAEEDYEYMKDCVNMLEFNHTSTSSIMGSNNDIV